MTNTPPTAGPVFCARCDQPIHQGQPYDTHVHHAANWAGTTNYSHQECPGPRRPVRPTNVPTSVTGKRRRPR
jgi:hypothetical protein